MKFKEFQHQPVKPDTYEASMALNQLMRIGKHAIKLHNMIDDAAEMESWVAKKIDLAGDYVKKVYNYTEGEKAGLYDDGGMTEAAPFGSGMDLVRMAVLRKFISAEEYMNYGKELKAAAEETAEHYDDWPDGEGFGSSDGNFAIRDMMSAAGYEFDEQDRSGRFIVTKMPEKLEKMGIKNVRMRDAVTTEDAGNMDLIGDGAENLGLDPNKFDYYYDTSGAGYGEVRTKSGKSILQFEYDRDGDAEVSTMDNKTIANIKQGEQLPNNVTAKLNMIKEDAGDQDDWTKLLNAVAQRYGKEKARVIHDYAQHGTDSGRELMRDYGLTPGDGWWEDQPQWFKKFPWLEKLDKTSWMSRLVDIAGQGPEYGGAGYEYPKGLESVSEDAGEDEKIVDMLRNIKQHLDNHPNMSEHPSLVALDQLADDLESGDKPADYESVSEDAGEGHMSKSTLYHTAKYAIELMQMINKGDDLEGWVQSKLNKAADYLQGVYNYEEYQKLNPYREELDASLMQKHAQVVQKNIDEILAKETKLDDIDTKPGMMRILAKRVNEVEKEIAKETRKKTDESGILYRAGVKKYGKAGMKAIQSAAGKGASHQEIGKIKDKHLKDAEDLEEGLKDWAKKTAMAGVIVAGLAGVGSIQDAIDRSVPAVQAMETALEMAQDQGNDELADMIKSDLSAVKVRLSSGKDLNFVKDMQDKYSKFVKTEGLAYESRLAIMLNQQLK